MTASYMYIIIDNRTPESGAVDNNVFTSTLQATQIADAWGGNYSVEAISATAGCHILELQIGSHYWLETAVPPEVAQRLLSWPLDGDAIADWFAVRRSGRTTAYLYVNEPDGTAWSTSLQLMADGEEEADDEWRREIAREAGMLHGCAGYNEAMGY